MTSLCRTTSNQRWNNVTYVNVEIYNVQQRWNNFVHFNVELNNASQRRNNVVIFNVDFRNVVQRRNNVVNMTIWKKLSLDSKTKYIFELQRICWTQNVLQLFPILRGICKRIFPTPQKCLKTSNILNNEKYI